MSEADGQGTDWLQQLTRHFQDKLTCGLYEAVYRLDPPNVETLMQAQARTCVGAFLELGTLRAPMTLDDFLQAMRIAGPSQIEIQRAGDVIHWTELHHGECVCPFIKRGGVRLDPQLCICGAHWVKYLFEAVAATCVDIETIDTVATGAQNCCFRIIVNGPVPQAP